MKSANKIVTILILTAFLVSISALFPTRSLAKVPGQTVPTAAKKTKTARPTTSDSSSTETTAPKSSPVINLPSSTAVNTSSVSIPTEEIPQPASPTVLSQTVENIESSQTPPISATDQPQTLPIASQTQPEAGMTSTQAQSSATRSIEDNLWIAPVCVGIGLMLLLGFILLKRQRNSTRGEGK